jgi:hypothetical protein
MTNRRRSGWRWGSALAALVLLAPAVGQAQVQVRLGEKGRATYSELHEALRLGTPAADSVLQVIRSRNPRALWQRARAALAGRSSWNDGLLSLTRLAELRSAAYADSARRLQRRIIAGRVKGPPGQDPEDLLEPLKAVILERQRVLRGGDVALRADIFRRIPLGQYALGDAWVLGRLGAGTVDSLMARFRSAEGEEDRVRWLTLLSFSSDTAAIPLLARVYVAPDSFGIPPRYGARASDGLLWIGTRGSLQALREARARARARGVYDDRALARGGYGFLANDSSAVISRTGKWLDEWIEELGEEKGGR